MYLVVHQPCNETDTGLQPYNPFHFYRIGTRADAKIHKAIACRYLSNNICTVVEEWTHGFFCLGYFSSSTHLDLVIRLAQKAWRQCVLVFAHDPGYRGGNCIGLLANTGLFFPLVTDTFPFDSGSLPLIQFSHSWRQNFVNEVSALWFSTIHGFPLFIVGNRYLLMNLHVVQFQYTSTGKKAEAVVFVFWRELISVCSFSVWRRSNYF